MAQLLRPGMLISKKIIEIDQSEISENSLQPGDFIKIQPVATGKNRVDIQPIIIENPENELENLWITAKTNDGVYQSVVRVIKKRKQILFTLLIFMIFIGDCSLNNNDTFFGGGEWVPENELLRTKLIQRIHDSLLVDYFGRMVTAALIFKKYFG